jgi:hypothetical protein
MPRDAPQPQPQPAPVPEPMDIPEMVVEHEMAFEPQREAKQEEQPEEYEDTRMRSVSRSDAQIYYTSRTPSWTYSPKSGTYNRSLQIFRGTLVRTGSRSRRYSKPSWTDCLQQQDLLQHHQPRDVFVMSWFIFIPLALCFSFSISAHCGQCRF